MQTITFEGCDHIIMSPEDFETLEKNTIRLNALCRALAGSWLYGNWRAETHNERTQEQIMRELGWWPITEDDLIARGLAIDAAMSKD